MSPEEKLAKARELKATFIRSAELMKELAQAGVLTMFQFQNAELVAFRAFEQHDIKTDN